MSEHNLFDEVKEDLERQRLEALWKSYGGWVVILALGIVLATAGSTAYRSWKGDHERRVTTDLLAVSKPDVDATKSIDQLQKFADANDGTAQAAFGLLRAGALAADRGDKTKAVSFFDKVAGDSKTDPALRQLGDLLSVQAQMDDGDATVLTARLQPLTAEHATWRYSALEDQAYLALRTGDKVKAKQIFTDLSQDARAPQTIAARASDILRSLNN